jgi:hypothetical protein
MVPSGCPETSERNSDYTLRKTSEERKSYLHRRGRLESLTENDFRCRKGPFNTSSVDCWDCKSFPLMPGFRYAQDPLTKAFTIFQLQGLHVNRWYLLWKSAVCVYRPIPTLNLKKPLIKILN